MVFEHPTTCSKTLAKDAYPKLPESSPQAPKGLSSSTNTNRTHTTGIGIITTGTKALRSRIEDTKPIP
jgi:hypothetical protein